MTLAMAGRPERFTILGADGFIGRALTVALLRQDQEVLPIGRRDLQDGFPDPGQDLGHAIYAIGLTADFRRRPLDTMEAHVGLLTRFLRRARLKSMLYLSSTRVYQHAGSTLETATIPVRPDDPDQLYDLSKLAGEALCLADPRPTVRVARLSNVYGPGMAEDTFLSSVIATAADTGRVVLHTGLESSKDYVALDDVVDLLPHIARRSRQRLYNVASGEAVSHRQIMDQLVQLTGCGVEVVPGAPAVRHRAVDIGRIAEEFAFRPLRLSDCLPALVKARHPKETSA